MSAMLEAMKRQDMVALVRRVYRKGTAPKLGVLIPEEKEDNGETKKVTFHITLPLFFDFISATACASALLIGRSTISRTVVFSMTIRFCRCMESFS